MKQLFLLIGIFYLSEANAQSNASNALSEDSYEIIRDILPKNEKLLFHLSIDSFTIGEEEKIILTKSDRNAINAWIKELYTFEWKKDEIKKFTLSKPNLTDSTKKSFNAEPTIYTITKPLFIRDNTVSLFYFEYICGSLCGHGELRLYLKQNDKWIPLWTLLSWIS